MNVTLVVVCGSLASVHGQYARMSVSRVSNIFRVAAYALFLAQVRKHRLASVVANSCPFLQERSRRCRLTLWFTASSHCRSDPLFSPRASFAIQRSSPSQESTARLEFGLCLRAVCPSRAKRFSESGVRSCQKRRLLHLHPCCGLRCRSVDVRDALWCTPFGLSRDYRIRRAGHVVARRLRVCRQPSRGWASSCEVARYHGQFRPGPGPPCSIPTCRAYSTEQPSQFQNLSIFHATQRSGLTDRPLRSRPQETSSPSFPLALQLYRCSIGFPLARHLVTTFFFLL